MKNLSGRPFFLFFPPGRRMAVMPRRVVVMKHRHLVDGSSFTLPGIDDIISRGKWADWADLHHEALRNPELLDNIDRICRHYIIDPHAQRYHFWSNYVKKNRPAA
ncbi:MAG: hypothetical protein LBO05_06170 [Deltaproteobacteria bacterium]|nr:hypothetical protein [Deltaproteobacteria bacterium]